MISKEEAKNIAEKKENLKAKVVDDHTDGKSYLVFFGGEAFCLVDKETGKVKSISAIDLLI